MKPKTLFAVTNLVNLAMFPVELAKLEVTLNAATAQTLYFQMFDSWVQPAAGAVPIKSWPAGECAFKDFKGGEALPFALGMWAGLSSTAGTYTAAAGTIDVLSVEFLLPEPVAAGTIVQVAATTNNFNIINGQLGRLLNLIADGTGLGAGGAFLMFFNKQTPANGDAPFHTLTMPPAVKPFNFGGGLRSAPPTNFLTVCVSSTPLTLTLGTAIPLNSKYATV